MIRNSHKEESLKNWVSKYTADLLSWATHKVSDSEIARDLVQDTFMTAVDKFEIFREESSPKTWLFSILNNKIIDHYRQKVRNPLLIDSQTQADFFNSDGGWLTEKQPKDWGESEAHLLDNEEFNIVLKSCIDALPEHWALGIRLKYIFNKKGEEICQELEITPTNYWQIMHRAKLQLRACVEDNWVKSEKAG